MFLKQVYNYSKPLFLAMCAFIVMQLFVNYKHGMLASPFYNYGMYSEPFKIDSTYRIFEVFQNKRLLQGKDFSPQQWDKILLPIQYYVGINQNNELYNKEVRRILSKLHLSTDEKNFLQRCDYKQFENWYKVYLQSITGETTSEITINSRTYKVKDNKLFPTDSVNALSELCH